MMKTTWEAGAEVDVLLAQLREDHHGVRLALGSMQHADMITFAQTLSRIQDRIHAVLTGRECCTCGAVHPQICQPEGHHQ